MSGQQETPARAGSPANDAQEITTGVSDDELAALRSQIDLVAAAEQAALAPERLAYRAERAGTLLPIVVNAAALVLVAAAAVFLPRLLESRGPAAAAATPGFSGESALVGTLQRESSQQIRAVRDKLATAQKERDTLAADVAGQVEARRKELATAMQAELDAEESRLEAQGASARAVAAQLKALQDSRQAALDKSLAEFEREKKAELAQKDAAIASLQAESNARADLERQVESLRDQGAREQLVVDQISGSYRSVAAALETGSWDAALGKLSALSGWLDQDAVASLPAVRARRDVDTFLIDSLKSLTESRKAASSGAQAAGAPVAAGPDVAAGEERHPEAEAAARSLMDKADALARRGSYAEAHAAYAALIRAHPESSLVNAGLAGMDSSLDALLKAKYDELSAAARKADQDMAAVRQKAEQDAIAARQKAEQDAARAEEAARASVRDRLAPMVDSLAAAARKGAGAAATTQNELIELLQVQVQVRQLLVSEGVRSANPDLAGKFDRYLDVTTEVHRAEGRATGMQDAAAISRALTPGKTAAGLTSLWDRYGGQAPNAAARQLIDALRGLFE
jgi:molecular chaperone GrpE (heat shock protein)